MEKAFPPTQIPGSCLRRVRLWLAKDPSSLYGSWGVAIHTLARCFLSWGFPASLYHSISQGKTLKHPVIGNTELLPHTVDFQPFFQDVYTHTPSLSLCSKRYSGKARRRPHSGPERSPTFTHVPEHLRTSLSLPHKVGRRPNIPQLGFGSPLGVGDEGEAVQRGPNSSLISTTSFTDPRSLFCPHSFNSCD